MSKRFFAILLAALLTLGMLASCGEQPGGQPASSEVPGSASGEPGTEPGQETEPATEPVAEPAVIPDKPVYEYAYAAPEDGSFTVCGADLSEYELIMYFPNDSVYNYMDRVTLAKKIQASCLSATGLDRKIYVVKNERYNTEKRAEHEILFGNNFEREGIPEADLKKNYYGVTADGTIYFCTPSPVLYSYLFDLFLEEFFGVPFESGETSSGCALTECYREIPLMTTDVLEACGYSKVFDDEFEGEEPDMDVWNIRSPGARRGGYNAASQITLADGVLTFTGEYRTEGEFGEGWYAAMISLKERYLRGYFESRIQCSEHVPWGSTPDFWTAFWIQGPAPYNADQSQGGIGPGGAELDILENFSPDVTTSCVWVTGVEGKGSDLCQLFFVSPGMGNDYANEFHTYAMLWDGDYYRTYVDGILISHSAFAYGTSTVPEEIILSLELADGISYSHDIRRVMKVDYLRIWQIETPENP